MNITITSESQRVIEERVRSGQYQSAEQVVEEALQWLEYRDRVEGSPANIERLRALVQAGIEQADRGECRPWDYEATKKQLHEEYARGVRGKR